MNARNDALKMAYTAGEVSMMPAARKARFFDCDESEVSDYLENYCMKALDLCTRAGVTAEENATAYSNGQCMNGKLL